MPQTYRATGINLKSKPMGEADRLLTILTREYGLLRIMATGSRKHHSKLGGRGELFVVNHLFIAKGKSLDKLAQAETLESYPGLAQDLRKLTAGQYLAELSLAQALSDQPQDELFTLLTTHLKRIELAPRSQVLEELVIAIVDLLALGGVTPQVYDCCLTGTPLQPELTNPNWRVGFSVPSGGAVTQATLEQLRNQSDPSTPRWQRSLHRPISAAELALLQELIPADRHPVKALSAQASTTIAPLVTTESLWFAVERILRQYAQYHFDRPIRSASLMDACFLPAPSTPVRPEV